MAAKKTMDRKSKLLSEIKLAKQELRLLEIHHKLPLLSSYLHLLLQHLETIEASFLQDKISKRRLEEFAFGIFRVVTDDATLEESIIGQKLLALGDEISSFSKDIEVSL